MWSSAEQYESDLRRIYNRVTIADTAARCWEWSGAITAATGYGKVKIGGKAIDTHRASWMLANGPIPAGMDICHRCDNRRCINPGHLFLGTRSDNMRDAQEKGRLRLPDNRGEKGSNAKLTWEQARAIRAEAAAGVKTADLVAKYGVDRRTVGKILLGHTWKEELA